MAENRARRSLRGEIIINTDASSHVHPAAVKALVAALDDPAVGVASGRDISVQRLSEAEGNSGESAYVGLEMTIRDWETRLGGIVGASGCLYAIRASLHVATVLPETLTRDFASVLIARERGYRSVSVPDAICYVGRTPTLRAEYRRKVRTVVRGLATLSYKEGLLNPFRYGAFAWKLWSHKVCRWLTPWAGLVALLALAVLSVSYPWARVVLLAALGVIGLGVLGWVWPGRRRIPRPIALFAFALGSAAAVLRAWMLFLGGSLAATWEPTQRHAAESARR
jgi:cellulose synthase/poly-beta-1,6-N-acetylglucosamine synthase-like glycosyltransferase